MHGFYDFTCLMMSAFSNNPNFSYQRCIDNGDSIVLASHDRAGEKVYENDFITGSILDPFMIQEKYDKVMGESKYFELSKKSDKLFDRFMHIKLHGGTLTENDKALIKDVVEQMTEFTAKKCTKYLSNGTYTQQEAQGIFNEFANKRELILQKYNIRDENSRTTAELNKMRNLNQSTSQVQYRSNNQITPNDITNLSVSATRDFPGQLSSMINRNRNVLLRFISGRGHSDR